MADRRSLGQLTGLELDPTRPAVVVDRLTESFRLYHERPTGLKERLYRLSRSSYTEFNALEDVSFTVDHGESVAVIGHNGSGKSTLLRLLARILPPDQGTVVTNGRVASLLELGAGFHGDLTGRENIYLNGAILGLSRAEIGERFDEIVDFAGIRPLLDTAVRTYSSGLYVRLGFSIAVTVDPDILLVDEVLAVGDAEFQARSLARMRRFHDEGKTILLVSHDLDAVREMCDRAIVLEKGRISFDGDVEDGVDHYRQTIAGRATLPPTPAGRRGPVTIRDAVLNDARGGSAGQVAPSDQVVVRLALEAGRAVAACSIGVQVADDSGRTLYAFVSSEQGIGVGPLAPGGTATVEVRMVAPRRAGEYTVTAFIGDATDGEVLAVAPTVSPLRVAATRRAAGNLDLAASAQVVEGPSTTVVATSTLHHDTTDASHRRS